MGVLPPFLTTVVLAALTSAAHAETCAPEACTGAGGAACPVGRGLTSLKASFPPHLENVYIRNAAPFPAEILRVNEHGQEISS